MRRKLTLSGISALVVTLCVSLVPVGPASGTPKPEWEIATSVNTSSQAEQDAYWTEERIRAAKPMPLPKPPAGASSASAAVEAGQPLVVPGTAPKAAGDRVQTQASVWVTIGRLFFTIPGRGDWVCSANVVPANNRSVIATARHCGFGEGGTNYRFAPAYNRGSAPYGWWTWRSAGWLTTPGFEYDNAFIVLNARNGQRIQDVVGATAIGFNQPINNYGRIIGLPAAVDYAVWCEGMPYPGPNGSALIDNCHGMSGGASGGALIVNYQPANGSALQTGSYFGSYGAAAAIAYYRDGAYSIWNGAQNS
jgi:hypothetical protein